MNLYSAYKVEETGYYIVNLITNTTITVEDFKINESNKSENNDYNNNKKIAIYGCLENSCKLYEPEESVYYYDKQSNIILTYKNGIWNIPSTSGYAYISIDPSNSHIYKFSKNKNQIEITIDEEATHGYYYTIDKKMYYCENYSKKGTCNEIEDTGYYFTDSGEIYYCIYDSEELEETECSKQLCISDQYYYINGNYYYCKFGSILIPINSKYCKYDENVIINFPLYLTKDYPEVVNKVIKNIKINNHSTVISSYQNKNYLKSVTGIFTNCTYNSEEEKSNFDLVCINNQVKLEMETNEIMICSIENLSYVECMEDEKNPNKCNISNAISAFKSSLFYCILLSLLSFSIFFYLN